MVSQIWCLEVRRKILTVWWDVLRECVESQFSILWIFRECHLMKNHFSEMRPFPKKVDVGLTADRRVQASRVLGHADGRLLHEAPVHRTKTGWSGWRRRNRITRKILFEASRPDGNFDRLQGPGMPLAREQEARGRLCRRRAVVSLGLAFYELCKCHWFSWLQRQFQLL